MLFVFGHAVCALQFFGFYSGIVEVSILVRYEPASVDNWSPTLPRQDI